MLPMSRRTHLSTAILLVMLTVVAGSSHGAMTSTGKLAQYCVPPSDDLPATTRLYCSR